MVVAHGGAVTAAGRTGTRQWAGKPVGARWFVSESGFAMDWAGAFWFVGGSGLRWMGRRLLVRGASRQIRGRVKTDSRGARRLADGRFTAEAAVLGGPWLQR